MSTGACTPRRPEGAVVIDRMRAQGTGVDRVNSRMIKPVGNTYTPLVSTRNNASSEIPIVTSESSMPTSELRAENAIRPTSSTAQTTAANAPVHGHERSTRWPVNDGITHPG